MKWQSIETQKTKPRTAQTILKQAQHPEMQQAIQIPRMQRETLLRMQKTATILKTAAIRTATATSPITKSSEKSAVLRRFFLSLTYTNSKRIQ